MEDQLYILLNNLLNPKKFPVALSLTLVLFLPIILELFIITNIFAENFETQMIITIESLSVLIGYVSLFLVIKMRIRQALCNYKLKRIYRLIGSFPAVLYLLSPGFISLVLGLILLSPVLSTFIGYKIIRTSHVDPSIIYTLLELNNVK